MFEREQFTIYLANDCKAIYSEPSKVLVDPQDKLKCKIKALQDYYIHDLCYLSMMTTFVHCCLPFQGLEQGFPHYCTYHFISSDADR